jgi:nucleolar protein 53
VFPFSELQNGQASYTFFPSLFSPSVITMESSAKSLETKKRKWIDAGAPAQKNQPTRKGKRAWRKNIDILDIEAGMEGLREEEIATGCV